MTEPAVPQESARAKRARIKAEREAAIAAAVAGGATPEEAAQQADAQMRERSKAEAVARSLAARAAAEARASHGEVTPEQAAVTTPPVAEQPTAQPPTAGPPTVAEAPTAGPPAVAKVPAAGRPTPSTSPATQPPAPGQSDPATPAPGGVPQESARAKRARIKAEREAAIAAAVAAGATPEEAAKQADQQMREAAKAAGRAAAAARAAEARAAETSAAHTAAADTPAAHTSTAHSPATGTGAGPTSDATPSPATPTTPTTPATPAGRPGAERTARANEQPEHGTPSLRAPAANRAPRATAPAAAEHGPSADLLRRFLAPSKAPARIGSLIYLVGFLNILSALVRPWRRSIDVISEYVPGTVESFATVFSVLSGIFLIMVAHSVKREKVRGWWAAVLLVGTSLLLRAFDGLLFRTPVASLLALAVLVLLLVYRKEFSARSDPRTRWRALWVFLGLLVATVLIGSVFVRFHSRGLFGETRLGFWDAAMVAVTGMLGQDLNDYAITPSPVIQFFSWLLMGLGLITILVPMWMFFRSARQDTTINAEDDQRIRSLLDVHPDSLGYFNTREDKEIVWSDTGKSGIGYRVVSGVILASGDPLGDPEAWPGAIKAFLDLADQHAWTPAVLGCSELAGTVWVRETGFQALEIGDEAIVDTRAFSLDGRHMRNVRQMVNRIRRLGYDTEMMRVRDTPAEWRAKALKDADAWRVGGTERGFSMATSRVFDADKDGDSVVIVATKDGAIEGMLQFAPWGTDGISLDLMRRNPQADPGINELLIVDALSKAPALGIDKVSLNFAMFRSTFERGERLGAGPVLKSWRRLLIIGNKWFQLESLYKFNAKFQPVWYPRFLIYPRVADFLRVSLAAGQAEAFIVFPRLTLPFGRRR